jgi:hypothetical protein
MGAAASNAEALKNARERGFSPGWDFWEAQHFYAATTEAMRRILLNYAKIRAREKRGLWRNMGLRS